MFSTTSTPSADLEDNPRRRGRCSRTVERRDAIRVSLGQRRHRSHEREA